MVHPDSIGDVQVVLPQYYRESFFASDSLFNIDVPSETYGVVGELIPYTVRNDSIITTLLIFCFVMAVVAYSYSHTFIFRQVKTFFRTPKERVDFYKETSVEINFQFFFLMQTCLLFAILQYFYTQEHIATAFVLESQYMLIAIYCGIILCYFLLKTILYTIVNCVFFTMKKNLQWLQSLLLLTSLEGIGLLPAIMLLVYFAVSLESVVIYFAIFLILIKMLTFYKCYGIFFRPKGGFLHLFLYFCALEVVPLTVLTAVLVITGNYLKINF